jgi:diadenosine tetraphosphate (Ap4A) HIT family hydrolase
VSDSACPLCQGPGGRLVAQTPRWRIIHAEEAGFPAFYRLVYQQHVKEFSQLPAAERAECAELLAGMEGALLRHLQPTKVNLASLGNAVPHLHWHVIARFDWDSHFPGPVWAAPQRSPDAGRLRELQGKLAAVDESLVALLPHCG